MLKITELYEGMMEWLYPPYHWWILAEAEKLYQKK